MVVELFQRHQLLPISEIDDRGIVANPGHQGIQRLARIDIQAQQGRPVKPQQPPPAAFALQAGCEIRFCNLAGVSPIPL